MTSRIFLVIPQLSLYSYLILLQCSLFLLGGKISFLLFSHDTLYITYTPIHALNIYTYYMLTQSELTVLFHDPNYDFFIQDVIRSKLAIIFELPSINRLNVRAPSSYLTNSSSHFPVYGNANRGVLIHKIDNG